MRIRIVGGSGRVEEVAPDEYGRGFRDVLAYFSQRQVALARRGSVGAVLAFEGVVPVEFFLEVVVERFLRAVALTAPFGFGVADLVDDDGADGIWILRERAEQHQAFAAVAVAAQVENFGAVGDFGGRVAGREFRHAALVMLADFYDLFERGREVSQVPLVLAFNGATGRVDGEVVRTFLACAVTAHRIVARDFAHVCANGFNFVPEYAHVVAVHREAVLVEIDSGDLQPGRQEKAVAAHAAAQVVYGTFARPERGLPAPDILRGALLQCEFVAQQELAFAGIFFEKFFAELGDERHVVHDGGAVLVAVARLVQRCRNLQCVHLF